MRGAVLFCGVLAWACGVSGIAVAAERVAVETADGRELTGVVDGRTDGRSLWLRREESGIVLAAAVAWGDVNSATVDGEAIEAAELRERRAELATEALRIAESGGNVLRASRARVSWTPVIRPPQVRNLEIVSACVVNLDRDVEPDGIEVSIAAIGDNGAPLPVAGSLTVSLVGERRPALASWVQFGELDHWTQPVAAGDFVDGVATYQLRFNRASPEWQFDLLPDAVVNAQLGAFGHGNYAASTPVVVRPFNPLRDDRQLLDKTRFLPGELRGYKIPNRTAPEDGLWLHWTR